LGQEVVSARKQILEDATFEGMVKTFGTRKKKKKKKLYRKDKSIVTYSVFFDDYMHQYVFLVYCTLFFTMVLSHVT
jgi:hypothetical protein